ncbi:MAG: 16S rRNA (guanine(966)-N(2))-methyltransferase RsmD [Burkholderiales bacterium]|nr:16S rRNA (guanine(966)-N(2))-methyltransferase RsmD [Burkholderiales bacterium]
MRIVGGRFRGRPLTGPRTMAVRPTSDRLRETLFNVLAHAYEDPVEGARVLDLFAGTGALGLEALSRGASSVLFVDDSTEGRGLVRANVDALGVAGITKVFRRDATRLGAVHPNQPFTLVFCDPPYGRDLATAALASAAKGGWFAPGALVVVEEAAGAALTLPAGLTPLEERDYGDTRVVFARAA